MAEISSPNAAAFGIWGPAYAQALAAQANDPTLGPLNMLALHSYMGQEQGGYADALSLTQQRQLALAEQEGRVDLAKQYLSSLPGMAQYGALGVVPSNQFGIFTDPAAIAARDAGVAQDLAAGAFKDNTAGVANIADIGLLPSPEVVSEQIFPGMETPPELSPYMTPAATADQMNAESRRISANADAVRAQAAVTNANRPRGGGGGSATTYTIQPPLFPGMPPQVTIRTRDPGMAGQYIDTPSGGNAVEQSGGSRSAQERLREMLRGRNRE